MANEVYIVMMGHKDVHLANVGGVHTTREKAVFAIAHYIDFWCGRLLQDEPGIAEQVEGLLRAASDGNLDAAVTVRQLWEKWTDERFAIVERVLQ